MIDLADYPVALFVLSAGVLWLSARCGVIVRKRYPLNEAMHQDFAVLLGASLTLLGLIIGFSFSMAAGRYDQRKNLEEAEANAIGTEYLRADLLAAPDAAKLKPMLKAYLDQRVLFYTAYDDEALVQINRRTAELQTLMWSAVLGPAAATPTPIVGLAVSGMNDVLNSQGYTQAAWWNRLPTAAWCLMVAIALCANFMVGYGSRSAATARRLLYVFPFFISVALAFIADIDAPRQGIIHVRPQNLISLAASWRAT
ncbi:MAG: hypothetical protein ACHQK9_16435 [Reyranellales bacterium]